MKDLLAALSEAPGVSGREEAVRGIFARAVTPLCDEVRTDSLGNCIALKRGSGGERPGAPAALWRPSLLIAAHMDEIGFLVSHVEKDGFLRVSAVGGIDPKNVLTQEVVVHGLRPLPGVIGMKPPHLVPESEREKPLQVRELFVDVGLPAGEVQELVPPGSPVTFARKPAPLLGDRFTGKALDNRVGVAAAVECLRQLLGVSLAVDLYVVATVQEELGFRGATVSTFGVMPSVGVAVDATFARQPGVLEQDAVNLGGGPAIAVGPNLHPAVHAQLIESARSAGLAYQVEVEPGRSGTDAAAIQITREGVPTGLVSIPIRNMHSPAEVVCLGDIAATARLLAEFARRLEPAWLEGLHGGRIAGDL